MAQNESQITSDEALERLEPRVELKEGYWVLKEKFRQGINPSEKIKIEKEPMKLITEDGINELAALTLEEIEKSKIGKDDIDVRLKWLGLFHRRKHHCKSFYCFMLLLSLHFFYLVLSSLLIILFEVVFFDSEGDFEQPHLINLMT